jgi:hypothetical protein
LNLAMAAGQARLSMTRRASAAERPRDRTLAWITFSGCLCRAGIALAFGSAIGRVADPRVMWHVIFNRSL